MIRIIDKDFEPFINRESLNQRVEEIGMKISLDYKNEDAPVFLGILNGSFMFLSDLGKSLNISAEFSFVKIASYSGTVSSGKIQDLIGLDVNLAGRNVIIVEDIVDTGLSMTHLLKIIRSKEPKKIAIATLLLKPEALEYDLHLDYVGFEIPNKFVVGYGLDYDGLGRNIPEIYQLKT